MRTLLFFAILLFSTQLFSQNIGFEEIDEARVSSWIVSPVVQYQGVYHFGDSEMESSFRLIVSGTEVYAQVESGKWGKRGEWISDYRNFTKVFIKGNRFYSAETEGEFVIYNGEDKKIYGLKIMKPWSGVPDAGRYEIGYRSSSLESAYSGKFPQGSLSALKESALKNFTKQDLKLMRNEIYARYGYIFAEGGEMARYFGKCNWYKAEHANVDAFLTQLEKNNIALIMSLENKKQ